MQGKWLQSFVLSLILLGPAGLACAGIFHVSPAGNDSNPGDASRPWRTIQKAANTITAGDTLYIRAGTYNERIIPKNSGTSESLRITYSSYPGETVRVSGTGIPVPEDEGLFHILNRKFITVSGLNVANSRFAGIYVQRSSDIIILQNHTTNTVSSGIGVWDSLRVTVRGNDVSRACRGGMQETITIANTDRFDVAGNHVHHSSPKEGICVKDGSRNGKVTGNVVHHVKAVGIYVDAWDRHTWNIEVSGNMVHHVLDSSGIQLSSEAGGLLEGIRVFNNIVFLNKYFGIAIADAGYDEISHPIRNARIVNNTAWNNGIPWGGGISIYNKDARNVVIRNNICSGNSAFQIAVARDVPGQAVHVDHNLIEPYMDYEDEVRGSDPVEADPQFVDAAGSDFQIRKGSPAVDRGASAAAPSFDFLGNRRPQDGDNDGVAGFDLGAYELPGSLVHAHGARNLAAPQGLRIVFHNVERYSTTWNDRIH